VISKGTRGQGFKGSSEMIKDYRDIEERHHRNQKNVKGVDQVFRQHTLESLTPSNPWTLFSNEIGEELNRFIFSLR